MEEVKVEMEDWVDSDELRWWEGLEAPLVLEAIVDSISPSYVGESVPSSASDSTLDARLCFARGGFDEAAGCFEEGLVGAGVRGVGTDKTLAPSSVRGSLSSSDLHKTWP